MKQVFSQLHQNATNKYNCRTTHHEKRVMNQVLLHLHQNATSKYKCKKQHDKTRRSETRFSLLAPIRNQQVQVQHNTQQNVWKRARSSALYLRGKLVFIVRSQAQGRGWAVCQR